MAAIQSRDLTRAADLTRQLSQRYPKSAAVHCLYGAILEALHRFPEAEAAIRRAIALEPKSAFAYFLFGNLEASRYFMRPVEIIETSTVTGGEKDVELIQFTIRGTFQMQGVESVAPPPPGTKGAPVPKGGKRG